MAQRHHIPSIFPLGLPLVSLALGIGIPAPLAAQPKPDYGLGIPGTAGTGGGTRNQPSRSSGEGADTGNLRLPEPEFEVDKKTDPASSVGAPIRRIQPGRNRSGQNEPSPKPRRATPYGLAVPSLPAGGNGMICLPSQGKQPQNCLSNFPRVILLSPDDGGRTWTDRPTIHWYVTDSIYPKEQPLQLKFQLFATAERDTPVIYESVINVSQAGLYQLTLPPEAALKQGIYQRWQINWQQLDGTKPASANSAILWEPKTSHPTNWQQMNLLTQARWYSQNYYWHDAVTAYTLWLDQNSKAPVKNQPLVRTVKQEISRLFANGLDNQGIFSAHPLGANRLHQFIAKLLQRPNL